MSIRRVAAGAGVAAVAAVAGVISYSHQRHLAATHGQNDLVAAIWPLAVDGLILACGVMVTTDRTGGYRPRTWAVAGFWLGVAVSVWANWIATTGDATARAISAFPAVALLIAVETLTSRPKRRQEAVTASEIAAAVPVEVSGLPSALIPEAAPVAGVEISDPDPKIEAAKSQVETRTTARKKTTPSPSREELKDAAQAAYRASVAAGEPLSGAAIGRQFGKSDRWGVGIVADCRALDSERDWENTPLPGIPDLGEIGSPASTLPMAA
ncbi:MAG: DUF2637 domain-containing protein [Longispora sp.]|nr:DUF2637 domain-containing protein [Longispora sp. (in: high G+C Gram-positive bacteria)]